jgi:hypothetical protein
MQHNHPNSNTKMLQTRVNCPACKLKDIIEAHMKWNEDGYPRKEKDPGVDKRIIDKVMDLYFK